MKVGRWPRLELAEFPLRLLRHAICRKVNQMNLISVVSWRLVSGYKTLLGTGRDPSCSLTSKGPQKLRTLR